MSPRGMERSKYFAAALACALCAGCLPLDKRQQQPQPAAAARKAVPQPTAEQLKRAEQLYYKAVGAYSANDMAGASAYLKEILAIHPSYAPALELREKIRLAGGRR